MLWRRGGVKYTGVCLFCVRFSFFFPPSSRNGHVIQGHPGDADGKMAVGQSLICGSDLRQTTRETD